MKVENCVITGFHDNPVNDKWINLTVVHGARAYAANFTVYNKDSILLFNVDDVVDIEFNITGSWYKNKHTGKQTCINNLQAITIKKRN